MITFIVVCVQKKLQMYRLGNASFRNLVLFSILSVTLIFSFTASFGIPFVNATTQTFSTTTTLNTNSTIASGETWTVDSGILTINFPVFLKIDNGGSLIINGRIQNGGFIINNGTITINNVLQSGNQINNTGTITVINALLNKDRKSVV